MLTPSQTALRTTWVPRPCNTEKEAGAPVDMHNHTSFTRLAAVVGTTLFAFTVSGCSTDSSDAGDNQVQSEETAVSAEQDTAADAEQQSDQDAAAEPDADAGASLPDDFPADVPLVEADMNTATVNDLPQGRTWMVFFDSDSPYDTVKEARDLLTAAGFTETAWQELSNLTLGVFENGTYQVSLSASDDEEVAGMSYAVVEIAGGS
ncbi:MAG: hypothetical protein ACTJFP_09255 [Agrococcus casei]